MLKINMAFEKKMIDGRINPKYVDMLDEDKEMSTQKYCCISFVSPEKIIKQKNMYFFEKFLKFYEFNTAIKKYHNFLNYISYKYDFNLEELMSEFSTFIEEEKKELLNTTVEDEYETFLESQGDKVQTDFDKLYEFQTNTRGIKIRGSFPTLEEAQLRAKLLREKDPNHDIYVGEVGKWMPFNPDAYKTGKVEYIEDELNSIMNYKANKEEVDKVEFDERVKNTKKKAIEENIEKATITGNTLTQQITDNGTLIDGNSTSDMLSTNLLNEVIQGENIDTSLFKNN